MSFFKVLLVGDASTGKTSLVHRIVQNTFKETYKATIGCEFGFKILEINGNPIRVQLWDIAGQDRIAAINRVYCRDAAGALVVCDLSQEQSIDRVRQWKEKLEEQLPDLPIVLCCNKVDLMAGNWNRTLDRCQNMSAELGFRGCFFTSAKTGECANEALGCLLSEMCDNQVNRMNQAPLDDLRSVKLGSEAKEQNGCKC